MSNKRNISVRLSESDLRRIKDIAARLDIKDSDLFRFSVKLTIGQLMPLLRQEMKGVDVLLTMLDAGDDLLRYFEFDSHQIDRIINSDLSVDHRVAMDDIDLVAIATLNPGYLSTRLQDMGEMTVQGEDPIKVLRGYLHKKYCTKRVQDSAGITAETA